MAKKSKNAATTRNAFVGLRMPAALRDALKELAAGKDRSLSYYVVEILNEHVNGTGSGKRKASR